MGGMRYRVGASAGQCGVDRGQQPVRGAVAGPGVRVLRVLRVP